MAFLARPELEAVGFKALGRNVLLSDRAAVYGAERMEIGDNVRIDDFCVLSGVLRIGRNVHISVFCNVSGGQEGVVFEDFSGLSPGCHVITESDDYSGRAMTNPTVPRRYRAETSAAVRLGQHCIIGAGSVILPGVSLAEGCAVGAMSLVRASTEPWGIYAGTPAKRRAERSRQLESLAQDYLDGERGRPGP
jgi:galactoside O-acetyltransferase